MKIGIFAKTFSRPTIEDLLEAIAGYEIYSAQFNLSCVGLETLPTIVPDVQLPQTCGILMVLSCIFIPESPNAQMQKQATHAHAFPSGATPPPSAPPAPVLLAGVFAGEVFFGYPGLGSLHRPAR